MAGLHGNHERQLGLDQGSELETLVEHAAVGGDEPVPRPSVVVERQQELPVIEVRHAGVYSIDPHQFSICLKVREDADDRIRKVVIEREQRGIARPLD